MPIYTEESLLFKAQFIHATSIPWNHKCAVDVQGGGMRGAHGQHQAWRDENARLASSTKCLHNRAYFLDLVTSPEEKTDFPAEGFCDQQNVGTTVGSRDHQWVMRVRHVRWL